VTRIKICGLTRAEDVNLALELGADAVGFIFERTSPRYIGDNEQVVDLARALGPYATCVAVFARLGQGLRIPKYFAAIQAFGASELGEAGWTIDVIRPTPDNDIHQLLQGARKADAILLDAYHPDKLGGTGERVDWNWAADMVQHARRQWDKPVILAGGLTPENVAEAIRTVRPYAVDVSSGIESAPGIKDHIKLRDFIQAARQA
jgi:phosphoribosylanthranilate isomerase